LQHQKALALSISEGEGFFMHYDLAMAIYRSEGDIYAGWNCTGRSFAYTGIAALVLAVPCRLVMVGAIHLQISSADQLFLYFLFYVSAGLFLLMAVCVFGSLMISATESGDVEITPLGVRRILREAGREDYFAREEIAGYWLRPTGGLVLLDTNREREIVVPRSIEGYLSCVEEIKALGIPLLSRKERVRKKSFRDYFVEWTLGTLSGICGSNIFQRHHSTDLRLLNLALFLLVYLSISLWIVWRKTTSGLTIWRLVLGLIAICAVLWRFW